MLVPLPSLLFWWESCDLDCVPKWAAPFCWCISPFETLKIAKFYICPTKKDLHTYKIIAGHRHQGRYRRHRHSGILYLSLVPEHSGTKMGPLNLVPDWFRHQHSFLNTVPDAGQSSIPAFTKSVQRWKWLRPARPYTAAAGVKWALWCWKIKSKCWNAEKKLVHHRHFYR